MRISIFLLIALNFLSSSVRALGESRFYQQHSKSEKPGPKSHAQGGHDSENFQPPRLASLSLALEPQTRKDPDEFEFIERVSHGVFDPGFIPEFDFGAFFKKIDLGETTESQRRDYEGDTFTSSQDFWDKSKSESESYPALTPEEIRSLRYTVPHRVEFSGSNSRVPKEIQKGFYEPETKKRQVEKTEREDEGLVGFKAPFGSASDFTSFLSKITKANIDTGNEFGSFGKKDPEHRELDPYSLGYRQVYKEYSRNHPQNIIENTEHIENPQTTTEYNFKEVESFNFPKNFLSEGDFQVTNKELQRVKPEVMAASFQNQEQPSLYETDLVDVFDKEVKREKYRQKRRKNRKQKRKNKLKLKQFHQIKSTAVPSNDNIYVMEDKKGKKFPKSKEKQKKIEHFYNHQSPDGFTSPAIATTTPTTLYTSTSSTSLAWDHRDKPRMTDVINAMKNREVSHNNPFLRTKRKYDHANYKINYLEPVRDIAVHEMEINGNNLNAKFLPDPYFMSDAADLIPIVPDSDLGQPIKEHYSENDKPLPAKPTSSIPTTTEKASTFIARSEDIKSAVTSVNAITQAPKYRKEKIKLEYKEPNFEKRSKTKEKKKRKQGFKPSAIDYSQEEQNRNAYLVNEPPKIVREVEQVQHEQNFKHFQPTGDIIIGTPMKYEKPVVYLSEIKVDARPEVQHNWKGEQIKHSAPLSLHFRDKRQNQFPKAKKVSPELEDLNNAYDAVTFQLNAPFKLVPNKNFFDKTRQNDAEQDAIINKYNQDPIVKSQQQNNVRISLTDGITDKQMGQLFLNNQRPRRRPEVAYKTKATQIDPRSQGTKLKEVQNKQNAAQNALAQNPNHHHLKANDSPNKVSKNHHPGHLKTDPKQIAVQVTKIQTINEIDDLSAPEYVDDGSYPLSKPGYPEILSTYQRPLRPLPTLRRPPLRKPKNFRRKKNQGRKIYPNARIPANLIKLFKRT